MSRTTKSFFRTSALLALLALPASEVLAETQVSPAAVTLESCGEVNAEEVQLALAIEYQEQEFGRTMLTVRCRGDVATLRIIGPNHPRGRITEVNLTGIAPVARSRTIAVLAAELWTAPEPKREEVQGPTAVLVDAPNPVPARLRPKYRQSLTAGLAVLQSARRVSAQRSSGSYRAEGDFVSLAFHVDWPVFKWLGVFTKASVSSETTMAGLAVIDAPVRWRRTETGLYIPLWRKRTRVDLSYSFGTDTITSQGVYQRNSERVLLPRYNHLAAGIELAYTINKKSFVTGKGTTQHAFTTDEEYSRLTGARWGVGYHYQINSRLRADASAEAILLSDYNSSGSRSYTDTSTNVSFALSYMH